MADFALWATACEMAIWPAGTFARCYESNRKAAIEDVVDADPVAACVREIMAERSAWIGTAADLLRAGTDRGSHGSKNIRLANYKFPRPRRPPTARADVLARPRHHGRVRS